MNFEFVKNELEKLEEPTFRFSQLTDAVFSGIDDWQHVKGWPQKLINHFKTTPFISYKNVTLLTSVDGTKKAKLTLHDGYSIETVLMQPKPGLLSVCVSCEVGCPMACAFCATGTMGLKRVLTSEEITDQWLFWLLHTLKNPKVTHTKTPNHLVFMGMGEPFHNRMAVFQAVNTLNDPKIFNLGSRKISISTCGVVAGIADLAKTYPKINLAISLHAATQEIRNKLMPISKAHSLLALAQSLKEYLKITNRQIMFEYILLKDVNDRMSDLEALKTYLQQFDTRLTHVNLIRFNPSGTPFEMPDKKQVYSWLYSLKNSGISASIRKNLGTDIYGACGQLIQN